MPPNLPPQSPQRPQPSPPDALTRFFGGRPLAVVFKLILLSVLVGVVLKVLGLDPFDIIRSVKDLASWIWEKGFDTLVSLWRYFLLGAVLVLPIWFIVRLVRAPKGR
jgi:hypothetical protein